MQLVGAMQVANSPYTSSQQHISYHNLYHTSLRGPQDHELKRRYLTLLSPQQIIEICLTFDPHVPPFVKSAVWPQDINAAIAGLQKPTAPSDDQLTKSENNNGVLMDSLAASQESTPVPTSEQEEKAVEESRPLDKEPEDPKPSPSNALIPDTAAPVPTAPPAYQQQAYGYTYPHAPYYPHPPPGYPYPHPRYPSYPPTYPPQPQPGYPPPHSQTPMYPVSHPQPRPDGHLADDMPSYEEMIVEALMDSGDPEGCAPKDLFSWMAARYPLQSNFRPSASQALQKAFKRGRLEKSSNNKYRLNAAWEGGNTSRRTTRRPQTHSHTSTSSNAASSSPFTHAPLVHHNHQTQVPPSHQPYQAQPYGYPYPSAPFPAYTSQPQLHASSARSADQKPAVGNEGEVADAYEAAQNILKAINFGSLLQLPSEGTQEGSVTKEPLGKPADFVSIATNTQASLPTAPSLATFASPDTLSSTRAELQAQLALLAAQLSAFAQEALPELQPSVPLSPALQQNISLHLIPQMRPLPPAPPPSILRVVPTHEPPEDEDSDDDDMEEVI